MLNSSAIRLTALRRERDDFHEKYKACFRSRQEFVNEAASLRSQCEQMAAALRNVEQLSTDRDARKWAANVLREVAPASPSPEPEPFGADVGRERLDEPAPGHTDLMVSPESIDAFMEANPLPPDDFDAALAIHPETADAGACGCVPGDCAAEADGQPCGRAPAPAISGGEMVSVPREHLEVLADFYQAFGWADRLQGGGFKDDYVLCSATYGKKLTLGTIRALLAALAAAGQKP
jgi:hypothetical protein